MNLELIEDMLEDANRETNQLIDLIRGIRKGEIFGEPLPEDIQSNLVIRVETKYAGIKSIMANLEAEISK